MPNESEFTASSTTCPHPERWTAADENATENEVLDLIAGLVKGLQPQLAVEAGTYKGDGARAIGAVLSGHGKLITLESGDVLPNLGKPEWKIDWIKTDATTWQPPEDTPMDFAFIDAGPPAVRAAIFKNFYPHMPANSTVVIHDTGPHRGEMRLHITSWEQQGLCKAVYLPTPRGLAILQVTK